MNPAFRRILALLAVFAITYGLISTLRTWRSTGDWRNMIPGSSKHSEQFKPESFTLPEKAPLDLGGVELLSRLNDEYAKLTEAVVPSVVSIDTAGVRSEQLLDIWGQIRVRDYPTQGQGSGAIVTPQGHVVTNHHVIAGQQKIQVTLHAGKTYSAKLIGEDSLLDIAVLKIDSNETFTPLKMGDSSQTKVGQIVLALGNPFGLGETVTQGIISAKERSISDSQRDLFQTDAAINPGNSGGPLVNLRGEIIGINVAIFSPDKQNPGFQGVGFSIPSNDVKDALLQILERGRPVRGFLGLQMRDLDPAVRNALGYEEEFGAAVIGVSPGSPAQTAGLEALDVVQSLNHEKIRSATQLFSLIQRAKVGEVIDLEIWRKGQPMTVKATIAESGAATATTPPKTKSGSQTNEANRDEILKAMGIKVRDASVAERMRGYRGVIVTNVSPAGLATGQVEPGDLIIAANNSRVNSASEFLSELATSAAVEDTVLHLIRDGQVLRVTLPALPQPE